MSSTKKLIIPIGVSGSGKSTFIDKQYKEYQIVCLDDIRRSFGNIYNIRTEPLIRSIGEIMVRAYMERGRSIVIDSTNTTEGIILKYLKLAKEYEYKTTCIKFTTPLDICIQRKLGTNKLTREVFERQFKQISELKDLFLVESFDDVILVDKDNYIQKVQ